MTKLIIAQRYGVAPDSLLNNPNISFRAKGLFTYLQSKPDGWRFSIERIAKEGRKNAKGSSRREGKDAIRAALQELEEAGYLKRVPTRGKDGRWTGYDYILFAEPSESTPSSDSPTTETTYTLSNTENSKTELVKHYDRDCDGGKSAAAEAPQEKEYFNWDEYLSQMKEHKQPHIRLIAEYFDHRRLRFSTKEEADLAIRRHLRAARDLCRSYGHRWDLLLDAFAYANAIYPRLAWTLETIVKILSSVAEDKIRFIAQEARRAEEALSSSPHSI